MTLEKNILIVEDEKITRTLIKNILEKHNYKVILAKNGEDALNSFWEKIDLVLLDLGLSEELQGKDVYKCLLKAQIPTIIVTANKDEEAQWLECEGIEDYICKPIDSKILIARVNNYFKRFNAEQTNMQNYRLKAIKELTGTVAHDFNNALQIILGNIDLALIHSENPDKHFRDYLETAINFTKDTATKIQELENYSVNNQLNTFEMLDLNLSLDKIIEKTKSLWEIKDKTITVERKYKKVPKVNFNFEDLYSIIYNLMQNSVESIQEEGTITFETKLIKDRVHLAITDTGEGMKEQTKQKIFHPFFTTKGLAKGKGLGMSITYSAAKQNGGEVIIKGTAPGKGTTIELLIPYSKNKKSLKKSNAGQHDVPLKILWVDDEQIILEMAKEMVQRLGHNIDLATGGKDALECLKHYKYDLLITDIGMPNMDGWQLIGKLQNKYSWMEIAVLTGLSVKINPELMAKYGINYFLEKPIEIRQVQRLIGNLLRK